jgi:hypothetical protein
MLILGVPACVKGYYLFSEAGANDEDAKQVLWKKVNLTGTPFRIGCPVQDHGCITIEKGVLCKACQEAIFDLMRRPWEVVLPTLILRHHDTVDNLNIAVAEGCQICLQIHERLKSYNVDLSTDSVPETTFTVYLGQPVCIRLPEGFALTPRSIPKELLGGCQLTIQVTGGIKALRPNPVDTGAVASFPIRPLKGM